MESKTTQRGQRGYILAMLLGAMAVVGILLGKAMPSVITEVQRENEEELIFRGEAIAKAIRVYKQRTGAYPTSLDALLKVKPRILRKLYKDPMTQDGQWDIVTAVQPGASGDKTSLPIAAIRSRCNRDSFRSYQGKTLYSDWIFSAADDIYGIPGTNLTLPTTLTK
ncbi:MAG: hypothetical protein H6Q00_345 [Holophagaceae bacterium]|nr:hypothetical protein [Holophagaceae bacterium]